MSASKELLDRAKSLYFAGTPIAEISRETGIKRTTLQYYVTKEWKDESNLRSAELLSKVSNAHSAIIASMTHSAILAVERAMSNMVSRAEPPTTKEAVDMVKILESLQKISDSYKNKEEEPEDFEEYHDPFA